MAKYYFWDKFDLNPLERVGIFLVDFVGCRLHYEWSLFDLLKEDFNPRCSTDTEKSGEDKSEHDLEYLSHYSFILLYFHYV